MQLKYNSFILFGLWTLFLGCDKEPPLSGTITLSANSDWAHVVYLIDPKTWDGVASSFVGEVVDSAIIAADGHFEFAHIPNATEPRLFELTMQQKSASYFPSRLENDNPNTSNYYPFIYKNGDISRVRAEAAHFQQSFSIEKPSPENAALLKLRDIRLAAYNQFLAGTQDGAHDEAALLDKEKAVLSFQKSIMQFAADSRYLLPALTAIRWVSVKGITNVCLNSSWRRQNVGSWLNPTMFGCKR